MPQILLQAHSGALHPFEVQGQEYVRKIKVDEIVRADIRRVRNPRQHRLWWGLVSRIHGDQDEWPTVESLSKAMLCAIGHGEITTSKSGIQSLKAKSIAFGNLGNDEFEEILTRGIRLVCERILPGVRDEDVMREVLQMIGE